MGMKKNLHLFYCFIPIMGLNRLVTLGHGLKELGIFLPLGLCTIKCFAYNQRSYVPMLFSYTRIVDTRYL